ncbi:hypothetical protein ANO14919_024160 [Xylariales sp. No.14919]|nr:hypothetical protein ANO14919_024160 [Xylariales sp. No.14919]
MVVDSLILSIDILTYVLAVACLLVQPITPLVFQQVTYLLIRNMECGRASVAVEPRNLYGGSERILSVVISAKIDGMEGARSGMGGT